jgi:hypothetical protein
MMLLAGAIGVVFHIYLDCGMAGLRRTVHG